MKIQETDKYLSFDFEVKEGIDRHQFLNPVIRRVRNLVGRYPLPMFGEIAKNIWDHADGKGYMLILKGSSESPYSFAFVAGDYGMQSFVYDFHVYNSRLKGNGVNQGRGLDMIRDFGKLICGDRFEISTERGFLYRGFFKLGHIQL